MCSNSNPGEYRLLAATYYLVMIDHAVRVRVVRSTGSDQGSFNGGRTRVLTRRW